MNNFLPLQILPVTITKIYHLFNILPISDYYLLLLNLANSLIQINARGFDNLPDRIPVARNSLQSSLQF